MLHALAAVFVLSLGMQSPSWSAMPLVELRKIEADWLGDHGEASDTPVVTATVRNRSKGACLRSVTGRIIYRTSAGKVLLKQEVELLLREVRVRSMLGLMTYAYVPVILRPKESVKYRYILDQMLEGFDPKQVKVRIVRVDAILSQECGYFPDLDSSQQARVDECRAWFMDSYWEATQHYRWYSKSIYTDRNTAAKKIVFGWCYKYGKEQIDQPTSAGGALRDLRQLMK